MASKLKFIIYTLGKMTRGSKNKGCTHTLVKLKYSYENYHRIKALTIKALWVQLLALTCYYSLPCDLHHALQSPKRLLHVRTWTPKLGLHS